MPHRQRCFHAAPQSVRNLRSIAEERVGRKCGSLRVLNSYWAARQTSSCSIAVASRCYSDWNNLWNRPKIIQILSQNGSFPHDKAEFGFHEISSTIKLIDKSERNGTCSFMPFDENPRWHKMPFTSGTRRGSMEWKHGTKTDAML